MIAAYCWPQSAAPGESVALFCSTSAPFFDVEVVRQGATDLTVSQSRDLPGVQQPRPPADPQHDGRCDWEPTLRFHLEPHWQSGFYLILLLNSEGERAEAFFILRGDRAADATLVLSTSTWAAYNDWGSPSFYTGSAVSSLQRPLPAGFLAKADPLRERIALLIERTPADDEALAAARYSPWSMAAGWANWELLFVRWAEMQGYVLNYAASQDLETHPELLDLCPAYLSVGHDEYWSAGMRDAVEGYVDRGGNAAFFSGNTAFWQARFDPQHSTLTCYKMDIDADPERGAPSVSTMWSDPLTGRPESEMTGVSFTRGGYTHMPNAPRGSGGYSVQQPDHWAFDGLDLAPQASLGVGGLVVGYECDGCELVVRDGCHYAAAAGIAPVGFTVLGTAPARLWETKHLPAGLRADYVGELNWVAQRLRGADTAATRAEFDEGHAVMGTFRRGLGEVFTVGCTDWAYGLGESDVATVTTNVLQRFCQRVG